MASMHPLGQTRTTVKHNHAFIAPDGYVPAALPGWEKTQGIVLISPVMMRARFSQYIAIMESGGRSARPLEGVQRFIYILEGRINAIIDGQSSVLEAGYFAYIPEHIAHIVEARTHARLLIFEKLYRPTRITEEQPKIQIGKAWAGDGVPFLGDEDARLRVLLPPDVQYDMAVNLFTFQPGTALPFVETHIMEHGLYLLEGQGIYRLDEQWYPIQANDTLWMGSYCPQWFCAIGKSQSTYIYYKDVNRDPLE